MSWDEFEESTPPKEEEPTAGKPITSKPNYEVHSDDRKEIYGIKTAIYGREKVGKTVVAASASLVKQKIQTSIGAAIPSGAPVVIIDTEEAAYWLKKFYPKEFDSGDIRIVTVYVEHAKSKEIDPIASFDFFWKTVVNLSTMENGTIVIDSATDIYQWINSYLRIKILELDPATKSIQADIKPSDWYWRNDKWETLMKLLRRAPCNVIITAKVKEVWAQEPDDKGKVRLHPTGRYEPVWHFTTPYWMDLLLFQDIRPINKIPTRYLRVQGSRAGIAIDHEIIKPNFQKIVDLIASIKPTLEW